jgi:hypothetical protein
VITFFATALDNTSMEKRTEVTKVSTISASFIPREVTGKRRQQMKHRVVHNVHAGHRFADGGQNGLFKFSIAAKAHAVRRNHQRDDQNVNLRAGENKGVSVRLEQREEEVALVKPGEEVDKRDGDNRLTTFLRLIHSATFGSQKSCPVR